MIAFHFLSVQILLGENFLVLFFYLTIFLVFSDCLIPHLFPFFRMFKLFWIQQFSFQKGLFISSHSIADFLFHAAALSSIYPFHSLFFRYIYFIAIWEGGKVISKIEVRCWCQQHKTHTQTPWTTLKDCATALLSSIFRCEKLHCRSTRRIRAAWYTHYFTKHVADSEVEPERKFSRCEVEGVEREHRRNEN